MMEAKLMIMLCKTRGQRRCNIRHRLKPAGRKGRDIWFVSMLALVAAWSLAGAADEALAQKSRKKVTVRSPDSETAALRSRVRQLEGQVLDMQVIIGTLQSLARSGGGSAGRGGGVALSGGGADNARIRQLETQIQALTAQVEQLSRQIRSGRRSDGTLATGGNRIAGRDDYSPDGLRPSSTTGQSIPGFGATTVTPGGDGIGRLLERDETGTGASPRGQGPLVARAGGDSRQLYETAYGYLLQQNFGRAQTAFREFLELYPNDPLAGNAQYWLGETYYVRRKYRSAANAFLKGYQNYPGSVKAPDNLLKLSMSLQRLGQKEAACSSYLELRNKFPRAPAHVRNKVKSQIRKLGC